MPTAGYDPIARQQAANAATVANQALALADAASASFAALAWQTVTANTLATDDAHLSVDTTLAPLTVFLPADGSTVVLRDHAGMWGVNPVTVDGGGTLINGQATFLLNAPGFLVTFMLVDGAWAFTREFVFGDA